MFTKQFVVVAGPFTGKRVAVVHSAQKANEAMTKLKAANVKFKTLDCKEYEAKAFKLFVKSDFYWKMLVELGLYSEAAKDQGYAAHEHECEQEDNKVVEPSSVTMPTVDKMEQLEKMLHLHDWTYSMSDDGRAWSNGEEEVRHIKCLAHEIGAEGVAFVKQYWTEKNGKGGNGLMGLLNYIAY